MTTTDQERIKALEERVHVLEMCLAEIEKRLKIKRRKVEKGPSLELPAPKTQVVIPRDTPTL